MPFTHISHDFPVLKQVNADGTRYYQTPDGQNYPSITTVLSNYKKEGILEWRKKVGEEKANQISRQATTRGTSVHALIEDYLHNLETQKDALPNAKSLFVQMKDALKHVDNIHCLETKLFSHELKVAGTVDCIAEYKGVLSVIDFKTAKRLKRKADIGGYFLQATAYAKMFEELTGINIPQIVILIGVDSSNFSQVLVEKPENYIDELKFELDNYRKGS